MSEWSSSSNHSSICDSSELASSESDDGDFVAELSRQMAECMLQEEEEEEERNTQLKNRLPVSKQVPISRGRKVKGTELNQWMQVHRRIDPGRKERIGSGMRAIFLGGSESRNGSSGTGVFLPRVANEPLEQKRKSGLSTVLIPTRVLEALELHFNKLSDSAVPPLMTRGSAHDASPADEWSRSRGHSKIQSRAANKEEDIQILPQEWTY